MKPRDKMEFLLLVCSCLIIIIMNWTYTTNITKYQ